MRISNWNNFNIYSSKQERYDQIFTQQWLFLQHNYNEDNNAAWIAFVYWPEFIQFNLILPSLNANN